MARISAEDARRMRVLREELDRQGMKDRAIIMTADGAFTCREVLKNLPECVELIGRISKNARLYRLSTPEQENCKRGPKRAYGDRLPTPEEIRKDQTIPWINVHAYAAGKEHTEAAPFV